MASTIPARRVARTTRTAAAVKENENALARPSRISTRSKTIGLTTTTNGLGTAAGMTRTTVASRAKALATADGKVTDNAPIKRKREAFGEVTTGRNQPRVLPGKGKEKENAKEKFDGVVIKTKPTPLARQPLRAVPSRQAPATRATSSKRKEEKETSKEPPTSDHAMAIDVAPVQVTIPSLVVRRAAVPEEAKVLGPKRHAPSRPLLTRREVADVDEDERVFKKRRTSSEAPQVEEEPPVEELDPAELLEARLQAEMEAFANEAEHDPETSPWDDLDADDCDDPLMVSEYVTDIVKYMRKLELTTMANPNYMESQKELAWKMRGILTDWLVQVHVRFRLLPETLFLCVNIIDRFLSARVVSLAKLQLVGITCLFIAAKFEEIVSPGVGHFLSVADSSYSEHEILQAERYVLKTLDWNLSYPNPVHFLRRVSKADDYNVAVRTIGKYLLEISCLEWRLIAAPPSLMAAASIWLARLAMGFEEWTANLAHYSGYKESDIVPTANLMLNYILKPVRHEAFFKKYAGKRFSKASLYMRDWALNNWDPETQVDLPRELPRLKAMVKVQREVEEQNCQDSEANFFEGETFVKQQRQR